MTAVILVHPGSVFVSGAAEVADWKIAEVIEGLERDLERSTSLIVIDGCFSDAVPRDLEECITRALARCRAVQEVSARVWGCDSGEGPYAGWQGLEGGFGLRHPDQEFAARAALAFLPHVPDILVTGAWATRDGSSGCVNNVAQTLRKGLPNCAVRVSPNALYEEYRDEASIWDDAPGAEAQP